MNLSASRPYPRHYPFTGISSEPSPFSLTRIRLGRPEEEEDPLERTFSYMAGRALVPIQPKPNPSGGNEDDAESQTQRPRKTRAAILVACDQCRRLKTKVIVIHPH